MRPMLGNSRRLQIELSAYRHRPMPVAHGIGDLGGIGNVGEHDHCHTFAAKTLVSSLGRLDKLRECVVLDAREFQIWLGH
jgi:hypothetical protein